MYREASKRAYRAESDASSVSANIRKGTTKDLGSVSVLIADDHPTFLEGLQAIISREPEFRIVARASNWIEVTQALTVHRPQLAILNLQLPGTSSANAIEAMRESFVASRIILFDAFDEKEEIYRALQAGAMGYLPKTAATESVRECIHAVRDGKTWIHPSAAACLVERLQLPGITSAETRILKLVADGKSNKQIGALLGITPGTVKVHVSHLFTKLGVTGRVNATLVAFERGIVRMPRAS